VYRGARAEAGEEIVRVRVATLVLTLAAAAASAASTTDPQREPWAGFLPASSVTHRSTTIAGARGAKPFVTESRTTLLGAKDGVLTLKSEFRVEGGTWESKEIRIDAVAAEPAGKSEDLGTETLRVDGKDLVCRKKRTVFEATTTLTWTHPDHGIVRTESTEGKDVRTVTTLERLSVLVKTPTAEVYCREVATLATSAMGTSATRVWLSVAVPGGLVRSESDMAQRGARMRRTTETVGYVAKR
jgi:hypothetical protein